MLYKNPPKRSEHEKHEQTVADRVVGATRVIEKVVPGGADRARIEHAIRYYLLWPRGFKGTLRTRMPSGKLAGYSYKYRGWDLATQRAAQGLASALQAFDKASRSEDLPFELKLLRWDLRHVQFPNPQDDDDSPFYVTFEQWVEHWIKSAQAAATKPPEKRPGKFEPAKRLAAELAAELLIKHGANELPFTVFMELAGAIYGARTTAGFKQHCRAVKDTLKKTAARADAAEATSA